MVLASVLGNLWDWVAGVFTRIGDVSPYWLVVALVLKTCESAFLGLTWRHILRAAYPKGGLSFKTAWGASQGGTAINAIAPAQAGTAAMIGIFRTSIPGASVAGVTSAAGRWLLLVALDDVWSPYLGRVRIAGRLALPQFVLPRDKLLDRPVDLRIVHLDRSAVDRPVPLSACLSRVR